MIKFELILLLLAALLLPSTKCSKYDKPIVTSSLQDPLRVPVTIEVYYPSNLVPSSDYLTLRGDNCNLFWNSGQLLTRTVNNKWQAILNCPEGVLTNVKVLYNDKVWMIGRNFGFIPKLAVSVQIFPSFNITVNKIVDISQVNSSILKNSRSVSVYLPPSYYENTLKKYQVLLMHDGQNLFDPTKAAFGVAWQIQDTINKMVGMGSMREIIVVGIWNTANRNNEYTYSYDPSYKFGGKGNDYLDFIQKELVPLLKTKYLIGRIDDSNGYYIGGSSLGGLISCYAAYTRPTFFTKAICMSSSFWWNSQDFNNAVLKDHKGDSKMAFYIDSGDSGSSQDGKNETVRVFKHLTQIGYQDGKNLFYYLDKGGQHSEAYWGRRFNVSMSNLFP